MSIELRVVLLFAATFSIGWIITRIRKAKVRLEDTFFWMVMSVVLLLLGLFPGVSYWLSSILGVISPANLVFFIMICLLFEKLLTMSIMHSQMQDKYVTMAAEMALRCKELERQIEELKRKANQEKSI
ncbi:hypothetical protein C819_03023 [Lachnospiraceae bacterium 10-1]|nr:hypothetical protein C819_03023 [Lachnospiraceae bacterium 10-1]